MLSCRGDAALIDAAGASDKEGKPFQIMLAYAISIINMQIGPQNQAPNGMHAIRQ